MSATPGGGESSAAGFDIRTNLRQVLAQLKEFDPALAREVRRSMRQSGDDMITAMGDLLDEYEGGVVSGKTHRMGLDSKGRSRVRVDKINTREANRSRSRGARDEVKQGLRTRVSTGVKRTSIRVTASQGDLKRALNTRSWRHPIWGGGEWVEQPGNQYFNRGAFSEAEQLQNNLEDALTIALEALATHGITFD